MTKANLKRLEEGKLYYSISEVCSMTGLEQHVLRYWESEFPQLRPKKNRSGNRAYRAKEIKIIRYIKYLLYEEMYTIPGAKKKMADANMSDLDGQLTLLRVPPTEFRALAPVASGAMSNEIEATETAPSSESEDLPGEIPYDYSRESGGDSPAQVGSADRLRAELERVRGELRTLLASLAALGKSPA